VDATPLLPCLDALEHLAPETIAARLLAPDSDHAALTAAAADA
jgi:hypothetical protein